jgi:hypothetical protein
VIAVRIDATGFSRMERALLHVARQQIPYAAARALNDVARTAQAHVNATEGSTFDRPTPFTSRAVVAPLSLAAQPGHLTATVTVRDIQAKYLLHEEIGGTRTSDENTLRPGGAIVLPGRGLLLDRFGGTPKGTVAKLAAQAEAARQERQAARSKRKQRRSDAVKRGDRGVFYVPRAGHGKLTGGFYQRLPGHRLAQLIAFGSETHYRPRMHYRARLTESAAATWPAAFRRRLVEAAATAR